MGDTSASPVDDQEPEEILVVAIDTSQSMEGEFAADDASEEPAGDAADVEQEPSTEACLAALAELRDSHALPCLRRVYAAGAEGKAAAHAHLSASSPVLRWIMRRSGRVDAILSEAAPAVARAPAAAHASPIARRAVPSFCVTVLSGGREMLLPGAPSYTVSVLMQLIRERFGRVGDLSQLSLLSLGASLNPSDTLEEAGVRSGHRLVAAWDRPSATEGQEESEELLHLKVVATQHSAFHNASRGGARASRSVLHSWLTHALAVFVDCAPGVLLSVPSSSTCRDAVFAVFEAAAHHRGGFTFVPATWQLCHGCTDAGDGYFSWGGRLSVVEEHAETAARTPLLRELRARLLLGEGLDPRHPVVLVKHFVGDRGVRRRGRAAKLARMDAVKQLFMSFANRLAGSNAPVHVGLVTFGADVKRLAQVTPLFERFIAAVQRAEPAGDTALFEAITNAAEMAASPFPGRADIRRRVLVLTDGDDSKGGVGAASRAAARCMALAVKVDVIFVTAEADSSGTTRAIANASGGLAFAPATLRDALPLMVRAAAPQLGEANSASKLTLLLFQELDTLLLCGERAASSAPRFLRSASTAHVVPPSSDAALLSRFGGDAHGTLFMGGVGGDVPPRKPDPSLARPAKDGIDLLADVDAKDSLDASPAAPQPPAAGVTGDGVARSAASTRAIMRELRAVLSADVMGAEFLASYDVYPRPDDLGCWSVVIQGGEGTVYQAGVFHVSVKFPVTYPARPPSLRFETQILHPNVNAYGRICIDSALCCARGITKRQCSAPSPAPG